jgi:hypothetical protein
VPVATAKSNAGHPPGRRLDMAVVTGMAPNRVSTSGGVSVVLTGTALGVAGDAVTAVCENSIGMQFGPVACSVAQSNTRLQCNMPPGIGTGLRWTVLVNGTGDVKSEPLGAFSSPSLESIVR